MTVVVVDGYTVVGLGAAVWVIVLVPPVGAGATDLDGAVVASAGWYTYLDHDRPFPRGVAPGERTGGRPVDVDAFLRIPIHVLVGERDVEQDLGLRTGKAIDRRQGPNRLTRALRWMDHLEEAAGARGLPPRVSFDLLTDTGHSFSEAAERGGLVDRTFDFLHPTPGPPDPIDDREAQP